MKLLELKNYPPSLKATGSYLSMQLWTTMKCAISNLQTELYLLIFISHNHTHLSLEFYLTHRKKIYKDLKNVHFCYLSIEKDANYSKEVIHQKQIFTISNQNNVISSSWWVLTLSFIYWNMIMIIIISCYVSLCNEVWLSYLQLLVCSLQELHFLCVFFLFHHSLFLCTFLDLITFSLQFIDLFF